MSDPMTLSMTPTVTSLMVCDTASRPFNIIAKGLVPLRHSQNRRRLKDIIILMLMAIAP